MKTHADLVAIIGPNEAGKSSLLRALAHVNNDEPFARDEQPRRSGTEPLLRWRYELDDDDKAAIADVAGAGELRSVAIRKSGGNGRVWEIGLSRERTARAVLIAHVEEFKASLQGLRESSSANELGGVLDDSITTLSKDIEDFGAAEIDQLVALQALLHQSVIDAGSEEEEDLALLHARAQSLYDSIQDLIELERTENPRSVIRSRLLARVPRMIMYTAADRNLQSSYDLNEVAESPPSALRHLSVLAGLSLAALRDEIASGRRADVATRRDAANRKLREAFDQAWNQQKIALQIDVDGSTLFVQALTLDQIDLGLSELVERSDGMRWFASLLAFVHGWSERPILLVDEIETHLHYDAQADLVNVLAQQEFTSKVIYSTHSLGCLPPDLGNGIRVVSPVDSATSRLENQIWHNGAGFSPLMTSLGAAAVSFSPSRHVVMSEGPSDAILLPTLFRQATQSERVPFQVLPGLSEVAEAKSKGLLSEAARVAFLVDGDPGGLSIKEKLVSAGVPVELITILEDVSTGIPYETEDLIDPQVYTTAVNAELQLWQAGVAEVTSETLGPSLRTKRLVEWCAGLGISPPDKIAVAERVIDTATDHCVIAEDRREIVKNVVAQLRLFLQVESVA